MSGLGGHVVKQDNFRIPQQLDKNFNALNFGFNFLNKDILYVSS